MESLLAPLITTLIDPAVLATTGVVIVALMTGLVARVIDAISGAR